MDKKTAGFRDRRPGRPPMRNAGALSLGQFELANFPQLCLAACCQRLQVGITAKPALTV